MRGLRLRRWTPVIALAAAACGGAPPGAEARHDFADLKAASGAYMQAWLSNDPDAVMATFVDEPVLSPSGRPFLEGQEAARSFWWPEQSPPTRVTRYDHEELEARASGDLGFVRGNFILEFEFNGAAYTNRGTYLHVLRKSPGTGWRISHHLWNDLPADREQ